MSELERERHKNVGLERARDSWYREWFKSETRIAELEAENERLQDRRCDGCVFRGKTCEPYRVWGCVHPDFSCNRWTARAEEGGRV